MSIVHGQYFEWTNSIQEFTARGRTVHDYDIDVNNNTYLYSRDQGCQGGCWTASVTKYSSQGNFLWQFDFYGGSLGISSISTDKKSSFFITGYNYNNYSLSIGNYQIPFFSGFLAKFDTSGTLKWVKIIPQSLAINSVCDKQGNIYLIGASQTQKRNYKGDSIWTNPSVGGQCIGIDASNKLYVMNSTTITKLNNNTGGTIWSKNSYNGQKLSVRYNGSCYLLNNDSLVKLNSNGDFSWRKLVSKANDLAVDSIGKVIVIDSTSVYCINSSGTSQLWNLAGTNMQFQKIVLNKKGDAYLAGGHYNYQEALLCPYRLFIKPIAAGGVGDVPFITKLNVTDTIPFQAGIFTDMLSTCASSPYNYLCTGKYYSLGFSYCTNSVSNFGPGNQFLVELLGGPVSPLIMGTAGNFMIPKSIPKGTNYQLRVSSTNPAITGYPNLPNYFGSDIIINPTIAAISASGNTTFCQGNSIQLTAAAQPEYEYAWLRNDSLIYPQGPDSTITADIDGIYKLVTIDKWCYCTDTASISIHVIPPPPATITASGPLSFCAGDSVILTANSGAGLTYQWKVNNVNIPFAFYQSYKATQAGNYKVKVTNSNGCTKISNSKTVSIICREAETAQSQSQSQYKYYVSGNLLSFTNQTQHEMRVSIFTASGALIIKSLQVSEKSNITIDGQLLNFGMYFLQVRENDSISWEKFIIGQ